MTSTGAGFQTGGFFTIQPLPPEFHQKHRPVHPPESLPLAMQVQLGGG